MTKKINENEIILSSWPKLDLHGETKDVVAFLVNAFIADNHLLHNYKIIIIHGIGKKIVLNECHEVLEQNELVNNYYQDNFNCGQTIVGLKK